MSRASDWCADARMYWKLMLDARSAVRYGRGTDAYMADIADEIDVLAQTTDWPLLKARLAVAHETYAPQNCVGCPA